MKLDKQMGSDPPGYYQQKVFLSAGSSSNRNRIRFTASARWEIRNLPGYIRKATRFSRLEIYETDLLKQIKQLLSDLQLALTATERADLFARMIPLHKRLGKVTTLLAHSPVLKADWLLT